VTVNEISVEFDNTTDMLTLDSGDRKRTCIISSNDNLTNHEKDSLPTQIYISGRLKPYNYLITCDRDQASSNPFPPAKPC